MIISEPEDWEKQQEVYDFFAQEIAARDKKSIHYITVGYVSEEARKAILGEGGSVQDITATSSSPAFVFVGLAYEQEHYYAWSHGKQERRSAVEFWSYGEIQMEHITLQYGPQNAEYRSVEETYLLTPWEDAPGEPKVKEAEPEARPTTISDDFDPFLDEAELP